MGKVILFFVPSNSEIKEVGVYHYRLDLLDEKTRKKGVEVEESDIPQPEEITGKHVKLMYNITTGEMFHEYVDRPLTAEEEMSKLKELNAQMGQELVDFKLDYLSVPCQYHQEYSTWVDNKLEEEKANGAI